MQLTVQFGTQIRDAAGTDQQSLNTESRVTVSEIVARLNELHGSRLEGVLVDGEGNLLPSVMVCVNGRQVVSADQTLSDGDEVLLMSAISGG